MEVNIDSTLQRRIYHSRPGRLGENIPFAGYSGNINKRRRSCVHEKDKYRSWQSDTPGPSSRPYVPPPFSIALEPPVLSHMETQLVGGWTGWGGGGGITSTDTPQEAKYVESWPNTTSAWAGWSRFDIPVNRYSGVHSLLLCTSITLGSSTCHQASKQENTY